MSESRRRHLDALEFDVEQIRVTCARDYRFLEGMKRLRRLQARIGYPSNIRLIRLRSRVHAHIAWFAVHSGLTRTALSNTRQSLRLSRVLDRQTADPLDMQRIGEVALIASNAAMLQHDCRRALRLLRLKRDASDHLGESRGSEYYRLRGVALFQAGADDDAVAHAFRTAMEEMERVGEAKHRVELAMTGTRHLNLLGSPNDDRARELIAQAQRAYGNSSLEHTMTVNWAAACALATDSPQRHTEAVELLARLEREHDSRFGHQATVTTLLRLTPALHLSTVDRIAWVRYALYVNAFRDQ